MGGLVVQFDAETGGGGVFVGIHDGERKAGGVRDGSPVDYGAGGGGMNVRNGGGNVDGVGHAVDGHVDGVVAIRGLDGHVPGAGDCRGGGEGGDEVSGVVGSILRRSKVSVLYYDHVFSVCRQSSPVHITADHHCRLHMYKCLVYPARRPF